VEITAKDAKNAKDSIATACATWCYSDAVSSPNAGELNHEEHKQHEVKTAGLQAKDPFAPFETFVVKNKQNQTHIP